MRYLRSIYGSITMLSILPAFKFVPTENELKYSLNFFPIAGVIIGLVQFIFALVICKVAPLIVSALFLTLLPEILSKGFHIDGVADTADGFLSGRSRERKLEIMRDSHIGSMGVLAIIAVLLTKFSCYIAIGEIDLKLLPIATLLSGVHARSALIWYISFSHYARTEGLGGLWFSFKPKLGMFLAIILPFASSFYWFKFYGVIFTLVIILSAYLWKLQTDFVIKGATGDTIGAFEEISECIILIVLAVATKTVIF